MPGTFEQLWRRQLAFTALAYSTLPPHKALEQFTEDDRRRLMHVYVESMHSELVEVLNTIPWKGHRWNAPESRERMLEEMVDVQKFLFGLMQVWGFTPENVMEAFNSKSDIVERRFYQDNLLPNLVMNKKVAIIDIDGVVADWKGGFDQWVMGYDTTLDPEGWSKEESPGERERLKRIMYEHGGMRSLSPIPKAVDAVGVLEQMGYTVVWLTARRIAEFPRLESDTIGWLKQMGLPTDYIYWSKLNKHEFIVQKLPMAQLFFDDKAEVIAQAKAFGIDAYHVAPRTSLDTLVSEMMGAMT